MESSPLAVPGQVSSHLVSAAVHAGDRDRGIAAAAETASGRSVTGRAFSAGRRLAFVLAKLSVGIEAAARHAGVARTKLSAALNDRAELRVDWLEAMPLPVQREYLTDWAHRIGLGVMPVGDADSEHARSHRVTMEATDVIRTSAVNEADGYLSASEAAEELAELRELKRALADREAHLLRVIEQRGAAVVR